VLIEPEVLASSPHGLLTGYQSISMTKLAELGRTHDWRKRSSASRVPEPPDQTIQVFGNFLGVGG
jgi:hypothetical protein